MGELSPGAVMGLLVAIAVFTVATPGFVLPAHRKLLDLCAWWGRRPLAWMAICALAAGGISALSAKFVLWPEPSIHDEFSHLLMAETFAEGKLALEPSPHWQHFETFHVIHEPTYASKYPPAPSVPLALGIALFDSAAAGLWLGAALMCAVFAWMLFGWMPARYAVLLSGIAVLQFGVCGPWVRTFYGGAVAATGGALLLGALGRLRKDAKVRDGILLALGLGVLTMSRPFEGLLVSLPVAVALLKTRPHPTRVVLPIVATLGLIGVLFTTYNRAVTGDAAKMPYVLHDETYAIHPPFLFQAESEAPEYRHAVIEEFHRGFQRGDRGESWLGLVPSRLKMLGLEFAGPLLLLLLVAGVTTGLGTSAAILALVTAGLLATTYLEPRYAAPATGALLLLAGRGWRVLPKLLGKPRARALSLGLVAGFLVLSIAGTIERDPTPRQAFGYARAGVVEGLLQRPGDDLVFVVYPPEHSVHHEFVVNGADLETPPILWARDLGREANSALIGDHPERKLWRLIAGDPWADGLKLEPYE